MIKPAGSQSHRTFRVPFPHPAAWFSPPGSRPLVSSQEVLPSLSSIAFCHASLSSNGEAAAPLSKGREISNTS
jgi:hypothetical protein